MLRNITFLCLACLNSAMVLAQDTGSIVERNSDSALNLRMPEQEYLRLAAAEPTLGGGEPTAESVAELGPVYKERWLTGNKIHKYAGIGSIALAILTGLAPKEYGGLHEEAARGALALGVVAVGTGLAFHFEDLSTSNFTTNPDNWHAMLTTLGVLGYATAVANGGEDGHAEAGVAGAALMLLGIKMTW